MNLLDTDIFSLAKSGHPRVSARVAKESPLAITIVTRIEILKGRFATVLTAANAKELLQAQFWLEVAERDLATEVIVPFTVDAAQTFDQLRSDKRCKRIGRADLLIASIALAQRATLVTRNVRHFKLVPGLKIENWAD